MITGRIITFYSYKGGVGRTLTLSNVARILAREGSGSVLVVDFDLEAPGLHSYFDCSPPTSGVVEYLGALADLIPDAAFQEEMRGRDRAASLLRRLPLEPFLTPTSTPRVSLLAAGRLDARYAERVGRLDLVGMFHKCPEALEAFREILAVDRTFILVDSRTGVSEVSGLTTALLADAIVAMFAPNRQNLDGLIDVLERSLTYRRRQENPRDLIVYPVASRFDDADLGQLQNWRNLFHRGFETLFRQVYGLTEEECRLGPYFDEVMLRHVPRYSYGEPTVVDGDSPLYPGSLRGSLEVLSRWILANRPPWEPQPDSEGPTAR